MTRATTDSPDQGKGPLEAPPLAIPLRAGPLRLIFDRGELRWIRLGEREVLRGIYAVVRERGWATVPGRIEALEIEASPQAFRIGFVARHRRGDVRFDWTARIEGSPDGSLRFAIDGVAGSAFLRNRIGFCVLHPASCAGEPCIVETADGGSIATRFPRLIAPHQPFLAVRAIRHQPAPEIEAEVRMEGDIFETEDQRNWSDASFKTYCTPLERPYPVEVREGDRVRQEVSVVLRGARPASLDEAVATVPGARPRMRDATEPVRIQVDVARRHPLPALGLAGAEALELDEVATTAVRRLSLSHLRADLRFDEDWPPALERAAANARRLALPLELALLLPEDPLPALQQLAGRATALGVAIGCWMLFRAAGSITRPGDAELARRILEPIAPSALFAGGSERYFVELNRARPPLEGLDRLSFSLNPQVHAFDDGTLFENLDSLPWLAETARSFSDLPLGISPITLRPRRDPRPPGSRLPGERPFTDDPRQESELAAAWTLRFLASAARSGFAALTFFELEGPRGVMQEGRLFPVYHAFAEAAGLPGAAVLEARSQRPERVQVLALAAGRRARLFLANLTAEPHPVRIEGLDGPARCAPLGTAGTAETCALDHDLPPRSVLRLDVGGD